MEIDNEEFLVSSIAVVPVFVLLLINYAYFGLEIPTDPFVYALFGSLTILIGMVSTSFFELEPSYEWALVSGIGRWLFVALAFSLKGIVESITTFTVAGDFSQIITAQFAWELPAMIGGYVIAYELYKEL